MRTRWKVSTSLRRKGGAEANLKLTLHIIAQSEADTRPGWRPFRALIAVFLVADRKPLLVRSAFMIERIYWVTCVAGFTVKISRPTGITVDSVLTDISPRQLGQRAPRSHFLHWNLGSVATNRCCAREPFPHAERSCPCVISFSCFSCLCSLFTNLPRLMALSCNSCSWLCEKSAFNR
jgi:hypothetical protein